MTISRKEIYQARTLEALIALAGRHGRSDIAAKAWAKKIIEHRNKKK